MSKWSQADGTRVFRAVLVDEYTDVTWGQYLRETSRADDGRNPAA